MLHTVLDDLLSDTANKWLEWEEPWPGYDENMQPVDVNKISRMTAADCIKMTRVLYRDKNAVPNNRQLLGEFIIIHNAKPIIGGENDKTDDK